MAKGKTEVVVAAGGRGTNILKKTLFESQQTFEFTSCFGNKHKVSAVRSYKYLGSLRDSVGSLGPEIVARIK
eukprot:1558043-Karenia_brevis.AAC.1